MFCDSKWDNTSSNPEFSYIYVVFVSNIHWMVTDGSWISIENPCYSSTLNYFSVTKTHFSSFTDRSLLFLFLMLVAYGHKFHYLLKCFDFFIILLGRWFFFLPSETSIPVVNSACINYTETSILMNSTLVWCLFPCICLLLK